MIYQNRARVRAKVTQDGTNVAGVRVYFHSRTPAANWQDAATNNPSGLDVRTDKQGQAEATLLCKAKYMVASVFVCAHARNINYYSENRSHQSCTIVFGKKKFLLFEWAATVALFLGLISIFLISGPYVAATFMPIFFVGRFWWERRVVLWDGVLVGRFMGFFVLTTGLIILSCSLRTIVPLCVSIFFVYGSKKQYRWGAFLGLWACTIWCLVQNVWRYEDLLVMWSINGVSWIVMSAMMAGGIILGFLGIQLSIILWFAVGSVGGMIPGFICILGGLQGLGWLLVHRYCTILEKEKVVKKV